MALVACESQAGAFEFTSEVFAPPREPRPHAPLGVRLRANLKRELLGTATDKSRLAAPMAHEPRDVGRLGYLETYQMRIQTSASSFVKVWGSADRSRLSEHDERLGPDTK